ncbi:MAG TPA: ABC transporter permease [Blastocatellia bacterium]|nr:ABC transporter permease [Blastocatellia bacterium]
MPDWKQHVRNHLAPLRLRPERELEITEELAEHLEAAYEEALARGASERQACEHAAAQITDWGLLECEVSRAERPLTGALVNRWPDIGVQVDIEKKGKWRPNMGSILQDLLFGARMMLRNGGFTAVAVLSLALGIGANTAIFSVVNAVLLRPLPYPRAERLVKVYQAAPDPTKGMLSSIWSYPRFEILREQGRSFAAVAGYKQNPYNLTGTNEAERLQVEMVSASYFPMLGVEALVGRTFTPEEERAPGANLAALLSYSLWQRRFGGDAQVLGKTLELDKHAFTIVGVLPPGFRGQDGTAEAWVTMMAAPLLRYKGILTNARNYWFQVIARLKDGVTPAQAQAEMQLISERIEQKYPGPKQTLPGAARVVTLAPLQAAKVDPAIRKSFLILLAAVGLVLLIACANVANLLLARAVARRKEFALRLALGAGRLRVVRQLLVESVLLALTGGALGILVARWGITLLKNFRPSDDAQFWSSYTRTFDFFTISLDWRVLAFTFALSLVTGVLFGLLPAIQSSRAEVSEALKEGAGHSSGGFHRARGLSARGLLVVTEIAVSLVLLVGAGLMLRSLARLQSVSPGFAPENVVTMAAPSRDAKPELYEQLLARLRALPGVESASLGSTAPLLGYASKTVMDIEGRTTDGSIGIGLHSVSPDYFKTLRINLLRGRAFTELDRVGAPRVAVINQAAAEQLFPGEDPIGKRIRPYIDPAYETQEKFVEIVGVVGDVKYGRLEAAVEPDVYLSSLQPTDAAQTVILRSGLDPASLASAVRREVLSLDKNVPLARVQTMNERAAEVTSRTRFIAILLGLFAALALTLSAVGIYGVMAYNVSARTRELGIRIALGAGRADVVRLVVGDGLALIAGGLGAGLFASWAAARVLKSQLYEVSMTDPLTFAGVALLLVLVALVACYLPARRATKVDPMVALRYE